MMTKFKINYNYGIWSELCKWTPSWLIFTSFWLLFSLSLSSTFVWHYHDNVIIQPGPLFPISFCTWLQWLSLSVSVTLLFWALSPSLLQINYNEETEFVSPFLLPSDTEYVSPLNSISTALRSGRWLNLLFEECSALLFSIFFRRGKPEVFSVSLPSSPFASGTWTCTDNNSAISFCLRLPDECQSLRLREKPRRTHTATKLDDGGCVFCSPMSIVDIQRARCTWNKLCKSPFSLRCTCTLIFCSLSKPMNLIFGTVREFCIVF